MPTAGATAGWLRIFIEPGDAVAVAVTVPSGSETGTWVGLVYPDARRGTPVATFTVSVVGQVVNLTLASTITVGLVGAGMARFTGHWDLTRTFAGVQSTWLKGDFVADAGFTVNPGFTL